MTQKKPNILVIGGGPAGLSAAEIVSANGRAIVTVVDRMPTLGRKFLMAGRSGLNLTNAESETGFPKRYGNAQHWLVSAIAAFPPSAMIEWAETLGQPCFTGSSGRIFPKSMKGSPLLRAWIGRLAEQGVQFRAGLRWRGWNDQNEVILETREGHEETLSPDAVVLALGGGSWARLGSDGQWVSMLAARNVPLSPLRPANCGFLAEWTTPFADRFAGTPLKRIALSFAGETRRGEAVLTERGLEGGVVYALAVPVRDAIETRGEATVLVDLRPDLDVAVIVEKLKRVRPRESLTNRLRKAVQLPSVAVALLRESGIVPKDAESLAQRLKAVPVRLVATDSLDRAISTAGGVRQDAVDERFMLRAIPGVFVCGEMLDWEAPTGGYLLQAVMATGHAAGQGVLDWLAEREAVARTGVGAVSGRP
ncbi:TIGR03862 family flavoprotein [Acetobacter conturbans]|uniref:TIGR03862 family flavoprotein n=1 Tax=Acetobacter conturbans TaxID=1737472 RepID=A0ABX0K4Y4_9PROT|nr:TIGR03862 family flavoprotein [Acetobacter conturbans]NHN89210.1 TIGR03862 family flavoprotein [Acetobacter conturbans]